MSHAVPLVYIMFIFLEQYVWNEVITTIAQVFIGKKVSVVVLNKYIQATICCALLTTHMVYIYIINSP